MNTFISYRFLLCSAWILLAISAARLHAQDTTVIRLGINTPDLEYAPTVTGDGRTLYFVSNRPGGFGGHDFWVTTKANRLDSVFTPPVNLGPPINTELNEGVASISSDGQTMYFTGCNRPDGLGDCDIYEARLDGTTWNVVRDLKELNSIYWDSQPSISSDGRTIFFLSNRSGAIGGDGDADIYYATRDAAGIWSPPRNLGPTINSPYREDSPFILPGGGALYFSSARPGGFGGLDFYVSRRNQDGSWGTPENLGGKINTAKDERFITLPASGDILYFSAERTIDAAYMRLDICMALLPPPLTTVMISGRVFERSSGASIPADLVFVDSASGRVISGAATNSATGEYSLVINAGESSSIDVYGTATGYGPIHEKIDIPGTRKYLEVRADIPLSSAVASAPPLAGERAQSALRISPNPASTTVTIESTGLHGGIEIDDVYGHQVYSGNVSDDRTTIDVARLPNGVYLARIGESSAVFVVRR
ncbi:MAG: rane protein [Chlorobi bacterium]|nr:rane protein [Chlorobiota bacterium]